MYLQLIDEALHKLFQFNCQREDLQISISPLVQKILERECYEAMHFMGSAYSKAGGLTKMPTMMGVQVYSNHPYNEIVIFHKDRASYDPRFIERIQVNNFELVNVVMKQPVEKTLEQIQNES